MCCLRQARALEAPDVPAGCGVGSVSASSSGLLAVSGPRRGQPGGACGPAPHTQMQLPVKGAQEREMCLVGWGLALGPHSGVGPWRRSSAGREHPQDWHAVPGPWAEPVVRRGGRLLTWEAALRWRVSGWQLL